MAAPGLTWSSRKAAVPARDRGCGHGIIVTSWRRRAAHGEPRTQLRLIAGEARRRAPMAAWRLCRRSAENRRSCRRRRRDCRWLANPDGLW